MNVKVKIIRKLPPTGHFSNRPNHSSFGGLTNGSNVFADGIRLLLRDLSCQQ